jgi:transglutaminase-like putative cysteine protease
VGLARAAGLPAKIMVGIAYHEGAFYYHAWPAVHVGRWVEMDPTWGQPLVDATHIRITEGELANQLELVQTVGTLTLDVLEQE